MTGCERVEAAGANVPPVTPAKACCPAGREGRDRPRPLWPALAGVRALTRCRRPARKPYYGKRAPKKTSYASGSLAAQSTALVFLPRRHGDERDGAAVVERLFPARCASAWRALWRPTRPGQAVMDASFSGSM